MEGIAAFCIQNRVITLTLTVVMLFGGAIAYQTMSRLEDPEFTIKDALVVTQYPGASAAEVEEEVTDQLELAIQQLSQLDEIESKSDRGVSNMTVSILNNYGKEELPQVWDELRRKVSDAQRELPPGAGPSIVVDDYGDVFGIFFVIYGEEYSFAEIKDYVDLLRRELVLVEDVARIETFGERPEVVYVEPLRDRMSQLGIAPSAIGRRRDRLPRSPPCGSPEAFRWSGGCPGYFAESFENGSAADRARLVHGWRGRRLLLPRRRTRRRAVRSPGAPGPEFPPAQAGRARPASEMLPRRNGIAAAPRSRPRPGRELPAQARGHHGLDLGPLGDQPDRDLGVGRHARSLAHVWIAPFCRPNWAPSAASPGGAVLVPGRKLLAQWPAAPCR